MTEENLIRLEQRVEKLEKEVSYLQEQLSQFIVAEEEIPEEFRSTHQAPEPVAEETAPEPIIEEITPEPVIERIAPEPIVEEIPPVQSPEPASDKAPEVSLESRVAKVMMPVAATALILFSIILFGSLIKPRLTDEMKAVILSVVSLGITLFGLWKMKPETKYYRLFSALAGCGIGACYVTTLVSHFVLGVLPEMALMVILVGWIVIVSLLSKYKSRTFAYICYIGILIAAYMTIQRWDKSPIGVIAYLMSIAGLFAANITKDYKKDVWFFIQLPVVLMAMALSQIQIWETQIIIAVTAVCSMVGQIVFYHKRTQERMTFLAPSFLSFGLLMASGVFYGLKIESVISAHLAMLLISVGLLVYYYRKFVLSDAKMGQSVFWSMFVLALMTLPYLDYGEVYSRWCGCYLVPSLLLMALSFIAQQKAFRYFAYLYVFLFALNVPSAMIVQTSSDLSLRMSTWVAFGLMAGYLYLSRKDWSFLDRLVLCAFPLWAIVQLVSDNWINGMVAYLLYSVYCMIVTLMKPGTFSQAVERHLQELLTVANLVGFFYGMQLIMCSHQGIQIVCDFEGTEGIALFLVAMVTLAQAAIETLRLHPISMRDRDEKERIIALYNGVKYTVLLAVLLDRLEAVSYVVSIAGILLAALFIVAGFHYRIKLLRVYGLLLTAFCVLKLLFFDIEFDNAFYRPVSLLLAGLLLFLISFLYFRLEKLTQKQDK